MVLLRKFTVWILLPLQSKIDLIMEATVKAAFRTIVAAIAGEDPTIPSHAPFSIFLPEIIKLYLENHLPVWEQLEVLTESRIHKSRPKRPGPVIYSLESSDPNFLHYCSNGYQLKWTSGSNAFKRSRLISAGVPGHPKESHYLRVSHKHTCAQEGEFKRYATRHWMRPSNRCSITNLYPTNHLPTIQQCLS